MIERRLADAEAPACAAVAVVADNVEAHFACHPDATGGRLEAESIVEIGSIAKGVTGMLLADMVLRGEAALEEPAAAHAPDGVELPALEAITLRELATHHSGLPRLPPRFSPVVPDNPYAGFDVAALYAALSQTKPRAGAYEYSNLGFMWLSDALARIAGKPFEVLLRERVLEPLGMADTAIALRDGQRERFAPGHGKGYKPASQWDMAPDLAGAGGLRSSLADMAKLARALVRPEQTPLEAAIALALEPHAPANNDNAMGLGWHILRAGGKRIAWHNGATGGFRSMLTANLHTGTAAVVLANSGVVNLDDLALHLVDRGFALRRRRFGFLRWW